MRTARVRQPRVHKIWNSNSHLAIDMRVEVEGTVGSDTYGSSDYTPEQAIVS